MKNEKSGVFKFRFDALSSTADEKGFNKQTVSRLIHSLSPFRKRLWFFGFVTLLYSISYVVFPRLLGSIFDIFSDSVISWLLGIGNDSVFSEMMPYLIFALIFFAANSLFAFCQGHIISGVVTEYAFSLRSAVNMKFNRLTVKYIDGCDNNGLIDRMTGVIDALNQSLNIIFMKQFSSLLLLICIIIMQFLLTPKLGLLSLIFCVLSIAYLFARQKLEKRTARDEQNASFTLFDGANNFFSGIETLQLSGKLEKITENLEELNRKAAKSAEKSKKSRSAQNGINDLLGGLCLVAVTVAGVFLADESLITVGILQCQIIYVRRIFNSVSDLSLLAGIGRTLLSSAENVFEFFDLPESGDGDSGNRLPEGEGGAIEFKDVSFRYDEKDKQVLDNLSLTIPLRGITSLSGITGAGKTTVIKLILGFYSPDEGRVLYKGTDVCTLNKREYHSLFNVIVQGAGLFDDTVYNNIAYGSEGVTSEAVEAAAKLTGVDEVISRLPDGYETVFNTSEPNLSDGEIQLVLLARAFLRKRDIVIFDEATSGIDLVVEKRINEALRELSKGCAVIVIAHRVSALVGATLQISLNDGKAKEKSGS